MRARYKCFQDVVGFSDRWIIIIGLPVASMLVSLMLFNQYYRDGNWAFLSMCIPMSFVYTGAFWWLMRWSYGHIRYYYPEFRQFGPRMGLVLLAFLVVFVLINTVLDNLFAWLFPEHHGSPDLLIEFIASILLTALLITIYEALSFYLQLQRAMAEKVDLERKNVESQLEGLRNQVNPHFLFNSLNTLIYLIPEDSDKAVRFVQQLSKVYRYVLESRDARLIPLDDELDFLKSYVFLLKERFGENLQVRIANMNGKGQLAVVPLSLQMLFENAIKHNILSAEKPLTIEVFSENGCLLVRNNLQRKQQVMDSTGIGLDNIQSRYRILTNQEVEVIVSQQYFTVLLPLAENETFARI
jgi:two-component system, LytTR family, sensor kinase